MPVRPDVDFGYRIRPCETGWLWIAFDAAGAVRERGRAPTKALAAACVIRAIARRIESDQLSSKAA